ncbi:MAG TPA: phosphatidylglycerol lysyltransferase domain-containing protein [Mycobacteriales bacterium]|nr:phosphatidylglycerol lysyltransferase domain-containing protein [Mycobacteriales bacterium]
MTVSVRSAAAADRPERRSRWPLSGRRTAGILAALTWLLGVLTIVSAVLPGQRVRVHALTQIIPTPASAAATAIAASFGVLLLYLSGGLRRRKRRAWRAALVVTVVIAASHVLKALDIEEAAVSLGLLALLIGARDEFHAKGDPTTRWLGLRVFFQLLALALGLGMVLLFVNSDRIVGRPSLALQFEHLLSGLVGIHGPLRFTSERTDDVVTAMMLAFGVLIAFATAYFVLRPSEPIALLTPRDEERLRELLARHGGRDSLGYFALRRDKSVVWSPTGKSAITYRVVHGVALASGDPIGDPEAWPGSITAFLDLAEEHAWVPAVMGCSETGATVYSRHGMDALELGDEAVVHVAEFTLDGRPMRGVRQAVSRVDRAGYSVSVRRAREIPTAEMTELLAVAAAWRGAAVERGFSMALSRLGDPADGDCVVVTAHREGVLRGLLHFVPWGTDGLSLDLMRRDRTADNGLNELLIVRLIESAPTLGVTRLSLNFAVFRSALERGERIGAGPVSRVWRSLLVFASRWWQIETLYRFNVKFRPTWEPRFVSFTGTRDLPRVAIAALEAEAFLVLPRQLKRLLRRAA